MKNYKEYDSSKRKLERTYSKPDDLIEKSVNEETISQDDVEQNKIVSLFSYLSVLILIPLFKTPNSKFAKFHIIQGINLLILEVLYTIISCLINSSISQNYNMSILNGSILIFMILMNAVLGIFISALSIIGIINVINGKMKVLPIIGKIKVIK